MAFQPKSYRKFVAASATAALAASAIGTVVSAQAADDFTDVDQDTRHIDAINALYELEVFGGFGDGTFGPEQNLKRSEAAEMIFNALGLEEADASELTFTDVPTRIEGKVAALVNANVLSGKSEITFGSDDELQREEMAKILSQAFGLVTEGLEDAPFSDLMDTKLYPHINAVFAAEVASGYENGKFGVGDSIKRGDFAYMLHAAMQTDSTEDPIVELTVADVDATVKDVLGIYWVVDIPVSELSGATADSTVTLNVAGDTVELAYNESTDSFRNSQVSKSYDEAQLNAAVINFDGETTVEEPVVFGSVADVTGSTVKDVLGLYKVVDLPLASLAGASVNSTVTIDVDGEVIVLDYNESNESFRNAQISATYEISALQAATVTVK